MNQFIIRITLVIFSLVVFSFFVEMLYVIEFVPSVNVFVRNYLYIIGFVLSILFFFVLNKMLLTSKLLKFLMIAGLVVCNARFYLTSSIFNKKFEESLEIVLGQKDKVYISKIVSGSALFGTQSYYRFFRKNGFFTKTIEIVYASGVQLIKSDTKFYVVKAYKKNGVDTLYIPVIH